jgi:membrane-associated protease RseP (regulator of RpoE activity)
MSNETPQADGEPTQSAPEAPAPEAPAASPPPGEPPTGETKPFTYDDAVKSSAGDEDDVTAAPPPVAAPAAPAGPGAPVPVVPVAADAGRPAGVFVPKWVGIVVAAIVAALVFGGIGYAIGDSSSGDSNSENAVSNQPDTGNRGGPFGNGNGQRQLPGNGSGPQQLPGNGGGTQTTGAFLGVAVQDATNGVGITQVQSGSPAATAGLQTGDVVTAIDGTNVTTSAALVSAIHQHSSGDKITVTYTRNGTSATATVTLGSRSSTQSS